MDLVYNHMTWNTEEKKSEDTNYLSLDDYAAAMSVEPSQEDGETETHEHNPEPDRTPSVESLEDTEPEEWTQDTDITEYGIQNMDRKPDGVRTH